MRRSSIVLALTGFYAAGTAAQSCPPQYAAVANWVADYPPAVSYCSSRYPGPTTTTTTTATVVVTQTSRTLSKRSLPTDIFAHIGVHDKPRPGHVQPAHSDKAKRQGYSWTNYYYSQMISGRGAAWVQGVCGCLIDPVTIVRTTARTITTWVAAPTPVSSMQFFIFLYKRLMLSFRPSEPLLRRLGPPLAALDSAVAAAAAAALCGSRLSQPPQPSPPGPPPPPYQSPAALP